MVSAQPRSGGSTVDAQVRSRHRGAESDPAIAARVKHYHYRQRFEFYDYEADPDALQNRIDDPGLQEVTSSYREKLVRQMRDTNDPALKEYKKQTE